MKGDHWGTLKLWGVGAGAERLGPCCCQSASAGTGMVCLHLLSGQFYLVCSQISPFFLTLAGGHSVFVPEITRRGPRASLCA